MTTNSETKQIRRVVTGHANRKSVIKSDEVLSTYHFKAIPGFGHTMIWASNGIPNLSDEPKADYPTSVIPVPGATNIQVVLFRLDNPSGPAEQGQSERHNAICAAWCQPIERKQIWPRVQGLQARLS